MLTYLIILLDDTSTSFCHYKPTQTERRLIDLDVLKRGIVWAMKENLNIQFVYPNYELPYDYREAVKSIDHTKIGPVECGEELDVVILNNLSTKERDNTQSCIWQCSLEELKRQSDSVKELLSNVSRLNVMLTDIPTWKQTEFDTYKAILEELADCIVENYQRGRTVQLNLLTDRLILDKMNNCGAGDTSITLAPDGRFYVCPAYYTHESIGSLDKGLNIPNRQLYQLSHAPICRHCDAFQCKRCVRWNQLLTMDCNTPSHEQCVAAHLERNASRLLRQKLEKRGIGIEGCREIGEIYYLDPFDIVNRWK